MPGQLLSLSKPTAQAAMNSAKFYASSDHCSLGVKKELLAWLSC